MIRILLLLIVFLLFAPGPLAAQADYTPVVSYQDQSEVGETKGFNHLLYFQISKFFETERDGETTFQSLGYILQYRFASPWAVEMQTGFRFWEDENRLHFPVQVGASYHLKLGSSTSLIPFVGAGPTVVIGNDYGAIFANLQAQLRFEAQILGKKSLMIGLGFGQAMAFHPSPFEYGDLMIGIRF